jgi:hypothetical protein
MIIDVHCHYTFWRRRLPDADRFGFEPLAEPGDEGDAPLLPMAFDACVSPRAVKWISWQASRRLLGLPPPGPGIDEIADARYDRHLGGSGPIDRFVLLAFDAVHDNDGRVMPLLVRGRGLGTDMYTSNTLVRDACRRHPERFLFGASVHPYRADAVGCVREVHAGGACLLKWIPLYHNIDVTDGRALAVFRVCAEIGLPLLLHFGEEFSLPTQRRAYGEIEPLLQTLGRLRGEGAMPTVIVAHVGTPATPWGSRRAHRVLLEAMTGAFADAPLYADLSALTAWTKTGFLRRLLRKPALHGKLLFGSDFPVPTGLFALRRDLGRDFARLAAIPSWPQRAAAALRRLGFGEIVFERAAEMLPNVHYFTPGASGSAG